MRLAGVRRHGPRSLLRTSHSGFRVRDQLERASASVHSNIGRAKVDSQTDRGRVVYLDTASELNIECAALLDAVVRNWDETVNTICTGQKEIGIKNGGRHLHVLNGDSF